MPLRDHFRPPTTRSGSWESLHGGWPAVFVQQLRTQLPPGFVSAPRVRLGPYFEIATVAFEKDDRPAGIGTGAGGTATLAPPRPTWAVETDVPEEDEYEVRIYNADEERQLVAVIEIVSPANKDRPDKRRAFVAKCGALLRKGVAVSIVDLVTIRHANLYAELMTFIGHPDPILGADPPTIDTSPCRWTTNPAGTCATLEAWSHPLTVGQPLPPPADLVAGRPIDSLRSGTQLRAGLHRPELCMTHAARLLEAANRGDHKAAAELLPLVYDELRKVAAAKLALEQPGQTLDATALVHEAYLRLVGEQRFNDRGHFFAAAAEAMRRILVEKARQKGRVCHGGNQRRVPLPEEVEGRPVRLTDVVAISEALDQLAEVDAPAAELVKLHYFAGLTFDQAASALGISPRKAYSVWAYARAWLFRTLGRGDPPVQGRSCPGRTSEPKGDEEGGAFPRETSGESGS